MPASTEPLPWPCRSLIRALELLALTATAGNIPAEQATKNVHILVEQMDPPRWPKLGAALPIDYDLDGTNLHGPNGLGGVPYPCSQLHNILPSDKVLIEQIRLYPNEVTIVCMGPLTVLASAIDRDPEFATAGQAHHLPWWRYQGTGQCGSGE